MLDNIPNMMRNTNPQNLNKTQAEKKKEKNNTSRHIIIKLLTKYKGEALNQQRLLI